MSSDFNRAELETLLKSVDMLDEQELLEIEKMLEELDKRATLQGAKDDLIAFCKYMDRTYKVGRHHRILADELMDIERGDKDRVCVNIPPRHGKSQLVSTYYPAWFIGRNPGKKVMLVSHTTDLAVDFGRKVRNIIDSEPYQQVFPNLALSSDSKSAGRWNTTTGCEFYATGVGSALAGRGADLLLVDDPHSEQDILNGNFTAFDKAYEWFAFGARTRLMPGGRVAVVHTRWHKKDLTGRLIQDMANNENSDQYEVVEFPAILDVVQKDNVTGEENIIQRALWPEFFDLQALLRTKASMPVFQWNAQYQQNPTGEEAAIIKRDWWRLWPDDDPPAVEYIIMSLDAAAEAHNRADFTSLTTWGVFFNDEENMHQIILLNAIKRRMEFPELKALALEEYQQWEPDVFIVEKKSSGTPLYQEMRRSGLMVQEYTPVRGSVNNPNSKMARLNSVSDIISSGLVWVPPKRWAEELVEEVAGFPFAENDDHCFVAGTQVLMADGIEQPIETIKIGDVVKTPAGAKVVQAAGCTGVRNTFILRAGGHTLEGTGNHPIATTCGWKRLDTITVTDTVKVTKQWGRKCRGRLNQKFTRSLLCSTATLTTAIRTLRERLFGSIFSEPEGSTCTALCGSSTMGLFQTAGRFTTRTEIGITTASLTLSAYLAKSTADATPKSAALEREAPSNLPCLTGFVARRASGTVQRKVELGTEIAQLSTLNLVGPPVRLERKSSKSRLKTRLSVPVRSAVRSFYRLLAGPNFAATRAQVDSINVGEEKKPVYNLTVADTHCYYANGVLVHNCDTTIMALMRFRQGGFIRLPTDELDEELPYRRKVDYY
jgi:predicted phage terminase large subunit-like protein